MFWSKSQGNITIFHLNMVNFYSHKKCIILHRRVNLMKLNAADIQLVAGLLFTVTEPAVDSGEEMVQNEVLEDGSETKVIICRLEDCDPELPANQIVEPLEVGHSSLE